MVVCFQRGGPWLAPFLEHTRPARRIAALELLGSLLLFMFAADMEVHIPLRTDNEGNAHAASKRSAKKRPRLDGTFGAETETGSSRLCTMSNDVPTCGRTSSLTWTSLSLTCNAGSWWWTVLDPATGPPGSPHAEHLDH